MPGKPSLRKKEVCRLTLDCAKKQAQVPRIQTQKLIPLFEWAYQQYHAAPHRAQDPLDVVHTYLDPKDREIAAFYGALLAYGNVTTIISSLKKVLSPFGESLHSSLSSDFERHRWEGFKHRFTTGEDILILSFWLGTAVSKHGSLEKFFIASDLPLNSPMKDLISDFVRRLWETPLPANLAKIKIKRNRNLKYLLSNPTDGSACKRLNMFFRWVVRNDDGIDLGLWKSLSPSQLMLPIDTHLLKVLTQLKWTRSKNVTWRTVEETTGYLRLISATDPIKYDFALCHLGMSGQKLPKEIPNG